MSPGDGFSDDEATSSEWLSSFPTERRRKRHDTFQGIQALSLASASKDPKAAKSFSSVMAAKVTSVGLDAFNLRRSPTQPSGSGDGPVPLAAPTPYWPMHFTPSVIFDEHLETAELSTRGSGASLEERQGQRVVPSHNFSLPSSPVDEHDRPPLRHRGRGNDDERMTLGNSRMSERDVLGWGNCTWQTFDVAGSEFEGEEPMYERAGTWMLNAGVQTTQGFSMR